MTRTRVGQQLRVHVGVFLAFAVLASCCEQLSAAPVKLSDLIEHGGTMIRSDQAFSEFAYFHSGDMPSAEEISVITFIDPAGDVGLRFLGSFSDQIDTGTLSSDASIQYRVRSSTSVQPIGASSFTADAFIPRGGVATITKQFFSVGANALTEPLELPTREGEFSGQLQLETPLNDLLVRHELHLLASTGDVEVPVLDQVFRQVPEPTRFATAWIFSLASLLYVRHPRDEGALGSRGKTVPNAQLDRSANRAECVVRS